MLDQLYQQVILDHNRSPHHYGSLAGATHSARGQDALCGDDILVELRLTDGRVEEAAFSGEACVITTASASMLMDWLVGRSRTEVETAYERFGQLLEDPERPDDSELGDINHLRAVSGFPARVRNALLPWRTVLRAFKERGIA
ncbi:MULTISPECIES: Fe-S cluster assembly sulfur transfer protein SufU [unclassified Wenzhouxiangella]|uniref:Fe-S cluster assembly sulfur transfer protein SufU n=1 Tax=unclassified Wenzhouxiangella TaxID=2613841 RepID=UPI000E32D25F|nr:MULTISPECIES: SUF system NifU family Fe-S cluster assembly protein [unclassified Wenzhouxiangella]RFF26674.1 SUF system NifU family Fe-S cluster assembly protein [Wenzhouxiangella sp. 15181]RFP67575.1 SUF system NifU family Fe-S cluster assembly protein [Wenzhouxiangella sp. 15190]